MKGWWDPRTAWAKLVFAPGDQGPASFDAFNRLLPTIPGVKLKQAYWRVPMNAIQLVEVYRQDYGVKLQAAAWGASPLAPVSWEQVETELRKGGELKPEYIHPWPRDFQKETITLAWTFPGYHLWHATGAGKTYSGITLALSEKGSVLVITISAVRGQFAREIERFTGARPFIMRAESQVKKVTKVGGLTWREFFSERMAELGKAALVAEEWEKLKLTQGITTNRVDETLQEYLIDCAKRSQRPWVVVGWEALVDHLPSLESHLQPRILVLDELVYGKGNHRYTCVHLAELPDDPEEAAEVARADARDAASRGGFIKEEQLLPGNPDSPVTRKMFVPEMNRAAAAARLARKAVKRIGMTATPITNRVSDLWGQLDTVEPNCWGNKTQFAERYCNRRPGRYGGFDDSGSSNLEELNMRLAGQTSKVPTHVAQAHLLHLKRRQSMYVGPEDQVKPLGGYGALLRKAKKQGGISRLELERDIASSKKRKAVISTIDEHIGSGQKVVVFSARKRDADDIAKRLKRSRNTKNSQQCRVWLAHGDIPGEERDQIVLDYMAHKGPGILIGTGQALGTGLELNDTDAAFFVQLPYTPGELRQWEGRFLRLSSTKACIIYYVIAEGTIDEHIANILIDKFPAVEEITGDEELAAASDFLAGIDPDESDEDFASAILADLDWD